MYRVLSLGSRPGLGMARFAHATGHGYGGLVTPTDFMWRIFAKSWGGHGRIFRLVDIHPANTCDTHVSETCDLTIMYFVV
jgi:hypothetical protein